MVKSYIDLQKWYWFDSKSGYVGGKCAKLNVKTQIVLFSDGKKQIRQILLFKKIVTCNYWQKSALYQFSQFELSDAASWWAGPPGICEFS